MITMHCKDYNPKKISEYIQTKTVEILTKTIGYAIVFIKKYDKEYYELLKPYIKIKPSFNIGKEINSSDKSIDDYIRSIYLDISWDCEFAGRNFGWDCNWFASLMYDGCKSFFKSYFKGYFDNFSIKMTDASKKEKFQGSLFIKCY